MTAAGHGRILGVTSGSGWRAADAGAYSCAKRAVAALTWRIGQETPPGVTVNALSPIAATRMVLGALSRAGASAGDSSTGGVSLGLASVPPPEHLGPVGAYLAGETFSSWSRGQIVFSNGAEVAWVVPPRLLEVARTSDVGSLLAVLESFGAKVLAPAEAAQVSNGGGNPRLGTAFADGAPDGTASSASRAVIVTDVAAVGDPPDRGARRARRRVRHHRRPGHDLHGASEQLAATRRRRARSTRWSSPSPAADVAVVRRVGRACSTSTRASPSRSATTPPGCGRCPTTRPRPIARSASSPSSTRPPPVVAVARSPPRSCRASAHAATEDRVDAFALSVEASGAGRVDRRGRRAPGVRRRRRCALGCGARRSVPTGSGCAAIRIPRVRCRSADPWFLRGSTARCRRWSAQEERSDGEHRSNASSTPTSTCGTRPTPSGTRTSRA